MRFNSSHQLALIMVTVVSCLVVSTKYASRLILEKVEGKMHKKNFTRHQRTVSFRSSDCNSGTIWRWKIHFTQHLVRTKVNEIIELLGLNKVTDTYVGKLSGGEKKRLSIGVELLTNPPFMFFDEPTSGLDSSSSYQVVTHLKSLAEAGRVIVCAIHQPSSRLFEMFDDVFILSEGNCFYRGPVNDMTTYFEEAGFVCPKYYNRADFAIEVVCGERGDNFGNLIDIDTERNYFQVADDATNNYENISEKTSMLSQIVGSSRTETTIQVMLDKTNSKERRFPVKLPTQFFILIKRCLLCTMRDLHMAQLRTIAHIVVGLLLGALYYGLGNEASKMSSNAACLFFFIMFLFFSNSMPTVHTFPVEASVFHREYLNNWYSLPAYYFSKIVAEIPLQILCPTLFLCIGYFLTCQPFEWSRFTQFWVLCVLVTILGQTMGLAIGAAFDAQLGIFLVPASSIPMILFSGFFLKIQDIPQYLHWLSYVSYFRYAFEGSMQCIYGYNRTDLECSIPYCYFKSPSKILEEFGMEESDYGMDVLGLAGWIVALQFALYAALKWRLKIS
ncbi:ATP-binding cassette sub-family G member 1-like isoform X2 [Periplaneta americana]|uniref:ATP-binding cassette sub-family G member 1-like isoform X2 n=2 Tax=Periplaneta americana TaxID=6978 RepID=UPI0037E7F976